MATTGLAAPIDSPLGREDTPMYGEVRQRDFPFVEAVVDLRSIAPVGNTDNLVPRGVILNLAENVFVCFDTELLRVAAVWQGDFVSRFSLAMMSYPHPLQRISQGQDELSQPQGNVVAATGLYPGWQVENALVFTDPRPRGVDPDELGRGPLPQVQGRWRAIEDRGDAAVLHYTAHGRDITERFAVEEDGNGRGEVVRSIEVSAGQQPLTLVVAETTDAGLGLRLEGAELRTVDQRYQVAHLGPDDSDRMVRVRYPLPEEVAVAAEMRSESGFDRIAATVNSSWTEGLTQGAYAVDELAMPYPNPWARRIRPMDIDFWPNGDAVIVTFDGDVYRLRGLESATGTVEWRRIATGFNEPQSVRVRDGEVFVFSRLGLTRLIDEDGDGDADIYRMFSNQMVQSAETRGYPASLVLQPDGSFWVTQGGIQKTSRSRHAGRALRISADGREIAIVAEGLRNSYLSRDPDSGAVTASDQQGNWVPATPVLHIESGNYFGYEPGTIDAGKVTEPPLWIPHRVVQSGIDQVWGLDERAGALAGSMLYLDYYRPRVVKILTEINDGKMRAAAVPLPVKFEVPLLKGEVNPADGLPYLVGMQIWGSLAPRIEGLCRLRPVAEQDDLPLVATLRKEGVWLRFGHELDPAVALNPETYRMSTWTYHRTASYGSGQYRADGSPGVDPLHVHAVLLSEDRRAVFLAVDNLEPVMQLEVNHRLDGMTWAAIYFTVRDEASLNATEAGFGDVDFDDLFAAPPVPRSEEATRLLISAERGREVANAYGCVGCHSIDGSTEGKSGPTWHGLYGKRRTFVEGRSRRANDTYLRIAVWEPASQIVEGYDPNDAGMPSYRGVLSDADVESLILYIKTLSE